MDVRLRRVGTALAAALLAAAGTVAVSSSAFADGTVYVSPGGTDAPGCGTSTTLTCQTIQHAIDTGATAVTVLAGTYAENVTIHTSVVLTTDEAATINGSVVVAADTGGAVSVNGFIITSATESPLIGVYDSGNVTTINANTLRGASTAVQTGIVAASSAIITGNTFALGSVDGPEGGAAIELDAQSSLAVTVEGNTGTVIAPTRTITEVGPGTVTLTVDHPNEITPAGAGLSTPTGTVTVPVGGSPVPFTVSSDSKGVALTAPRYDFTITGMSGLPAADLVLEYQDATTAWQRVALTGTASAGLAITGSFPLSSAPANPTTFRFSAPYGAPPGNMQVVTALDEVLAGTVVNTAAPLPATPPAPFTLAVTGKAPTTVSVSFSPAQPTSAQVPTANVTVTSAGNLAGGTVTVSFDRTTRTATLSNGRAAVALANLTGGTHTVTVRFAGTATTDAASGAADLDVARVATTLRATTVPRQLTTKSKGTAVVTVSAPGAVVNGALAIVAQGVRVLGTAPVVNGVARVPLPRFSLGQHNLTVVFPGTSTATDTEIPFVLRVALG